jgi:hypothetical protein
MRALETLGRWWLFLMAVSLGIAIVFWPEYRRYTAVTGIDGAVAQAILLTTAPRRMRRSAEYFYEYHVDGRRYAGSYSCKCEALESLKRGEAFPLRYSVARPEINLPGFMLARSAYAIYWLAGAAVLALLAIGARLAGKPPES